MKKQYHKDIVIDQFPMLNGELNDFLGIKPPIETKKVSAFHRFMRYTFRPLRFLCRKSVKIIKFLWIHLIHAFHIMFLLPEKQNPNSNYGRNVFLLRGEWGIGKTYLVSNYFESNLEAHLRYKPVFIDLFGVSSIDELNKKIVKSVSYSKKDQNEKSVKIYAKATLENKFTGLSASLEIGIILSKKIERIRTHNLFVEQENRVYKKHKYRYIKEPVIILDDIERKDKQLSLQSIIGFVDIFKKKNIKIILIANLKQLELEEKEMYHLLDRAVDRSIYIYDIKTSISSFIELFQKENHNSFIYLPAEKARKYLDLSLTSNLRTFKRFCEFLEKYGKKNYTYADKAFLNIVLLCIICQCEGRYDYGELVIKKTEEKRFFNSILKNNNQDNNKTYNELYDETNAELSQLKKNKFETFYLLIEPIVKDFGIIDNNAKNFVKTIFDCLECNAITALGQIRFCFATCALHNHSEITSFPHNMIIEGPYSIFEKKIESFDSLFSDEDESKFYLFFEFANYIHNCFLSTGVINKSKAMKLVNERLHRYMELAINELIDNRWKYDISFSRPRDLRYASNKYNIYSITSLLSTQLADLINNNYKTYGLNNTIELIKNISSMSEDCYSFEQCLTEIKDSVLYTLAIDATPELMDDLINMTRANKFFNNKIKPVFQKALNEGVFMPFAEYKLKSRLQLTKQASGKDNNNFNKK